MGKSARTPIVAAGGIVIRTGARQLVAVVQRRRDNAWVLPKGKLKPNEKPVAAARREAIEETGSDVRVYEYLGVISYVGGSGPKVTHFWRMHAVGSTAGKPLDDIKAVEWLPLSTAIERLSLAHEQSFLRNVGREALKKSRKKARKPSAREIALPAADIAPAIREKAPPPAERTLPAARPGANSQAKLGKPQPRWQVLQRLTKRWQSAVGRTQRVG
jgi:8-oxo-dGTP diphosphatase